MASIRLNNLRVQFDSPNSYRVWLFGYEGEMKQTSSACGAEWFTGQPGQSPLTPSANYAVPARIQKLIETDEQNGHGDQISYVIVGPEGGVDLCSSLGIENSIITLDHLQSATEREGFVDIPNVQIGGHTLIIRISLDKRYAKDGYIETADASARPIP